jgi:hypothetical protein
MSLILFILRWNLMSLNDMVAESFVKEFPMTESQVLKWPIPYQEWKVTENNYH